MSKKYITIKDIAKETGFSINTVSRALNNKSDINLKTKEIILDTVKKMGYVRNNSATQLRGHKSMILGVITPDSSNPFFSEVYKYLEILAENEGYQIILMNSEGFYEKEEKAISVMLERRVDGLIIFPTQQKYDDIIGLINDNVPAVFAGREIDTFEATTVFNDDVKGGYLATKELTDKKCRNIIMITDELYNSASVKRLEGFKKALISEGLVYNPDNVLICKDLHRGTYIEQGKSIIREFIMSGKSADGIFCYNDLIAYGVISELKRLGIKVPDSLKVTAFDDIYFSEIFSPSLTTVRIDKKMLAEKSLEFLKKNIENEKNLFSKEIIDVELIKRKSSGGITNE